MPFIKSKMLIGSPAKISDYRVPLKKPKMTINHHTDLDPFFIKSTLQKTRDQIHSVEIKIKEKKRSKESKIQLKPIV